MKKYTTCLLLLLTIYSWSQTQVGSDLYGTSNSRFGTAIKLGTQGLTVAIGIPGISPDDAGLVRVFTSVSGDWVQVGPDILGTSPGEQIGTSISLGRNGSYLAVGTKTGYVRSYFNPAYQSSFQTTGGWAQIDSDQIASDMGGPVGSIDLSSDQYLVVGVPDNLGAGATNKGTIRAYRKNHSYEWQLILSDLHGKEEEERFGHSISVSSLSDRIAIGAPLNDDNGTDSGQVRVYTFNSNSGWFQIGGDISGDASGDQFGSSVSISLSADILVVSAPYNDTNGMDSGQVKIYRNPGANSSSITDEWIQIGAFYGSNPGDLFGTAVQVGDFGNILAIGAPGNGSNPGYVRVFQKDFSDNWFQVGPDIIEETIGTSIGTSLGIMNHSAGTKLALNAPLNSENGTDSGLVRVYDLSQVLSTDTIELSSFSILPNPVKEEFSISLNDQSNLVQLKIYNQLGQLLLETSDSKVNISNFPSGVYFVHLRTDQGNSTKKLIKE